MSISVLYFYECRSVIVNEMFQMNAQVTLLCVNVVCQADGSHDLWSPLTATFLRSVFSVGRFEKKSNVQLVDPTRLYLVHDSGRLLNSEVSKRNVQI